MAESGDQDKSEAATPFALEEARKKGIVLKSPEINSAVAMVVGLIVAMAFATWATKRVLVVSHGLFNEVGTTKFSSQEILGLLGTVAEEFLYIMSPLFVLLIVGAVLSNILQSGFVFSTHSLTPDFSKINPATGFKRLFSKRTVVEAIKSTIKLSVFGAVTFYILRGVLPELTGLYVRAPQTYPAVFSHYGNHLLFVLLLCVVFIAVLDLLYTRWEFLQKMRMSRRELKQEMRSRDGDPLIRKRLRELQRELRQQSSSVTKVREADVLITNPEHFAVALKYRRGFAPAPEVIAKGAGDIAQEMRRLAFKYHVPIMPNPPLARALFRQVSIGKQVPEQHYSAIAQILKWAYAHKQRHEGNGEVE